jgi:hypothetical protein
MTSGFFLLLFVYVKWNIGAGMGCPVTNQIVINEADEGKGEELRAGKPMDEEEIAETRHSVGKEEFRGMNGLEKKYNLVIVRAQACQELSWQKGQVSCWG